MSTLEKAVPAAIPSNEAERLRALKEYCDLEGPPDPSFEHLVRIASTIFDVPIALISLVDEHRQFFKAKIGIPITESPRESSFCAHTILSDKPLVVSDTHADERFRGNPFVLGDPYVRFYASAPLISREGLRLGGFSIIDVKPRPMLTPEEHVLLERFSALAVLALDNVLYPERLAKIEREVLLANERYRLATQATAEGIWDWDCVADRLYQSARARTIVGLGNSDAWVSPNDWVRLIHPADRARLTTISDMRNSPVRSFYSEYRVRHADGDWRWIANHGIAVRDTNGALVRMVGAISDVTDRQHMDSLTGLYSKNYLLDFLEVTLERGFAAGEQVALFCLDIDSFKLLNSALGRTQGDELLKKIGVRLAQKTGGMPETVAARLSSDEFVIAMRLQGGEDEVRVQANEIRDWFTEPIATGEGNSQIVLSLTIGIATASKTCLPSTLVQRAEVAVRECKRQGPGGTLVFAEGMEGAASRILLIVSSLSEAVHHHQFETFYQPQFELEGRRIRGCEALVRFSHPTLRPIPNDEIIGIAEKGDIIFQLGEQIIAGAIAHLAHWRKQGVVPDDFSMAINLSARQLTDHRLCEILAELTDQYKVPPRCLALEITEGVLIGDTERALEVLRQLVSMGFRIDLDDFGKGYSSLSYLQKFPIHTIKVDRSFVMQMAQGQAESALVQSIISLGKALNLEVVAEGIETDIDLGLLQAMGCRYGQGYLVSKALPEHEFRKFVGRVPAAIK
ncbi:MAG TPA: EAL domain-containing protein [Acidobacteriaceae bacterium]|jgi:diguanylate cyclase (GGDEF)-like protein/PAS domain S-box-containing protein